MVLVIQKRLSVKRKTYSLQRHREKRKSSCRLPEKSKSNGKETTADFADHAN